jgi:hypothetical protein
MAGAFVIPTLVLVLSMILSMAAIFREVMPHLNEDDQVFLRGWFGSQGRRLGIRETLSRQCPANSGSSALFAKYGIGMPDSFRKAASG